MKKGLENKFPNTESFNICKYVGELKGYICFNNLGRLFVGKSLLNYNKISKENKVVDSSIFGIDY